MYDRHLTDCLEVQSEVAAKIARSLATELVPPATPAASPPDAAAYQALLKGRYYWRKTADTGVMQALSYYEEALALDPDVRRRRTRAWRASTSCAPSSTTRCRGWRWRRRARRPSARTGWRRT